MTREIDISKKKAMPLKKKKKQSFAFLRCIVALMKKMNP